MTQDNSIVQRIVATFLHGNLSPLLLMLSLVAGFVAMAATPREEDPQIVVPVADVVVEAPGASALEVERQIATPLEQIVARIPGIENVYSTSARGRCVLTARFLVGEDREASLVKLHSELQRQSGALPAQVQSWVVQPVSIDDVPVFVIALHSATQEDFALRRIGEEIAARLQQVPDAGKTDVHGGRSRQLRVEPNAQALASRGLDATALIASIAASTGATNAGTGLAADRSIVVESTPLLPSPMALRELVIGATAGRPVYLRDVATVMDGPEEPTNYVRFWRGGDNRSEVDRAAVVVAVAKRRGSNAVHVTETLRERMTEIAAEMLPSDVEWTVTRDSGATADGKVEELLEGLWVAIAIVVILITMMLGWREAIVVALAVPITFGLTLLVNLLLGYTINRVTLFALILALGLVVDDPIVDVENIHRHLMRGPKDPKKAVLDAVNEVRPPVITATIAVVLSFIPLFFITGMMGPYMRPMAVNVPVAMFMSMVVAFTLTPWMSWLALRKKAQRHAAAGGGDAEHDDASPSLLRAYGAVMRPLMRSRTVRWTVFGVTAALFAGALALGALRAVPLKMLPFDNKTELQVLVDLDEGSTLERTHAVVAEMADAVRGFVEVVDVTSFAGSASPIDFNGLVRKYYMRASPELGELRVTLLPKTVREQQSHGVALRIRERIASIAAASGAVVKVVELPPGPPVLATVVAEVRGPDGATPQQLEDAAQLVAARLRREPGVVDVDSTVEHKADELRFSIDREKAALHGVSSDDVGRALRVGVGGVRAASLHDAREVTAPAVVVRMPVGQRADAEALGALPLRTASGAIIPLAEVGRFAPVAREGSIHRKDLQRVAYVLAEAAGRPPAEIVLDVDADRGASPSAQIVPLAQRSMLKNGGGDSWSLPDGFAITWRGEGEWKITLDAFRDLGLAFLAACLGIYVLLVHETKSYAMPLVLMLSIPFTILGILPGFWLLNLLLDRPIAGVGDPVFFTATAMIGMIALAGIAVRNSILLIDFVEQARLRGMELEEAIVRSGAVRLRPIVLTGGTAILASIPITLDPIFSGLAWALIFGLVVSSAFTLVLVPVIYGRLVKKRAASE
jgi:multidrug efflux pump subunit AcrB